MRRCEIVKTFDFDAAHRLPCVPEDHKCYRLHGHTYRLDVHCEAELDDRGMVIEYGELGEAVASVLDLVDHRYLNEISGLENPTTEALAPWFYERLHRIIPLVAQVVVWESATTRCVYPSFEERVRSWVTR